MTSNLAARVDRRVMIGNLLIAESSLINEGHATLREHFGFGDIVDDRALRIVHDSIDRIVDGVDPVERREVLDDIESIRVSILARSVLDL